MSSIKPGKYEHYKGKFYEVIGIARDRKTMEEYVVYRALYDCPEFGKNALWIGLKKMFLEKIKINEKEVPKFRFIGENDLNKIPL